MDFTHKGSHKGSGRSAAAVLVMAMHRKRRLPCQMEMGRSEGSRLRLPGQVESARVVRAAQSAVSHHPTRTPTCYIASAYHQVIPHFLVGLEGTAPTALAPSSLAHSSGPAPHLWPNAMQYNPHAACA